MNETGSQSLARRNVIKGGLVLSVCALGLDGQPVQARAAAMAQTGGARIDITDVQVLFADLQGSLVSHSRTQLPEAIGRSANVLAQVASILKLPMLFSVVPEGSGPSTLIPELATFSTPGNTIRRVLAGCFMDEPTKQALARTGCKTLVLAGYAAEVVVLQTVLDAIAAGYTVYYVVDAIGSKSARTEDAAFREMERAGAIPTSVLSLTTRLTPDFFHAPGSQTFAALQILLKQ